MLITRVVVQGGRFQYQGNDPAMTGVITVWLNYSLCGV